MDLQFKIDESLCIQCNACVDDCPYAIIEMGPEYPIITEDRADKCIRCQHCLAVCPTAALSILGRDPEDSLPLKSTLPNQQQMETLIQGRRSMRRYEPEPLASETISRMLDIVAGGPTGVNNRQCLFTVIEDQSFMEQIRQTTMEGLRREVKEKRLTDRVEYYRALLKAWDKGRDVIFRRAPHLLIVSSPATGPSPEADALIALSYFELLASSQGIGTLWNGLAKWAFNIVQPNIWEMLSIPSTHTIGYVMSFGRPDVQYFRTVQRSKAQINRL